MFVGAKEFWCKDSDARCRALEARCLFFFLKDDGLIASQTIFIKSAALHLLSFPDKSFFFPLL